MPRVLNRSIDGRPADAVYIGRPSKWGNPFVVDVHGSRSQVIARYERFVCHQVEIGVLDLSELRGKDLVCWCAPQACHGDVLLRLANKES